MFNSIRELFDPPRVWMGTPKVWNDQIGEPIQLGIKKNTFQNSDAEKVGVAVKCCKVLADNISRIPINIINPSAEGNLVDKTDYRYPLLRYSPDGMITSQAFFSALEYNRNLRGNAFAKIVRNPANGKPIKFELIPSAQVEGYKVVRGQLYYIYFKKLENGESKKVVVNSFDMLHFKMASKNGVWGMNPIEAQRMNMSTLYKSKNVQDAYYENNAFVPAFLKSTVPDANFIKPFNEAMQQFKEKNVGPMNAGNIATLPPFTEIQQLDMNIVDAEFLAGSKFDAQQIAAFYDVPPHFVGLETGTFRNIEELTRNFATFGLGPIVDMYVNELEYKLLSEKERMEGYTIEFKLDALIETDLRTKAQWYKDMFGLGVMTGNDIALEIGLPIYAGGEKHFIPSNNLTPITGSEEKPEETVEEKDI
jgi:HK97 family phage portal protein